MDHSVTRRQTFNVFFIETFITFREIQIIVKRLTTTPSALIEWNYIVFV